MTADDYESLHELSPHQLHKVAGLGVEQLTQQPWFKLACI